MVKESACNAEDTELPGLGRSAGERNGNPLIFLPEKPHEHRSLARYSLQGCKKSDVTELQSFAAFSSDFNLLSKEMK